MKITLLLLALCLAVSLVSAIRINYLPFTNIRHVYKPPKFDLFGHRDRRSPGPLARAEEGIKGGVKEGVKGGVKRGHPAVTAPPPPLSDLEKQVRKGEYVCGPKKDRICKLKPGVVPPNCHGICQYPL